jgi:hypothetical protein
MGIWGELVFGDNNDTAKSGGRRPSTTAACQLMSNLILSLQILFLILL